MKVVAYRTVDDFNCGRAARAIAVRKYLGWNYSDIPSRLPEGWWGVQWNSGRPVSTTGYVGEVRRPGRPRGSRNKK